MAGKGFPSLPTSFELGPAALRQIAVVVNGILGGKQNNVTTLTLTHDSATTTFQDSRLGPDTHCSFEPLTANAAAERGNGTMYVLAANRGKQTWTISHANNAQTDRTFSVEITG